MLDLWFNMTLLAEFKAFPFPMCHVGCAKLGSQSKQLLTKVTQVRMVFWYFFRSNRRQGIIIKSPNKNPAYGRH